MRIQPQCVYSQLTLYLSSLPRPNPLVDGLLFTCGEHEGIEDAGGSSVAVLEQPEPPVNIASFLLLTVRIYNAFGT